MDITKFTEFYALKKTPSQKITILFPHSYFVIL